MSPWCFTCLVKLGKDSFLDTCVSYLCYDVSILLFDSISASILYAHVISQLIRRPKSNCMEYFPGLLISRCLQFPHVQQGRSWTCDDTMADWRMLPCCRHSLAKLWCLLIFPSPLVIISCAATIQKFQFTLIVLSGLHIFVDVKMDK
jgi:hypothetical protein